MREAKEGYGLTFLISEEGARIELHDNISGETFVEVVLTPTELCQAMSRLSHTPCQMRIGHLDRVGKKMLMDKLRVEMPSGTDYKNRQEVAVRVANECCPEGWIPDNYFGSQDSFYLSEGREYAKTTMRKWVAVGDEEREKWANDCNNN